MSIFDFQGKQVYYRTVGEGHPLLLLNGIMMSTKSWLPFLDAFQQGGNRLILVDLLDQGESQAMGEDFPLALQAEMLEQLLQHLGIASTAIFGTSYGGEVALNLAVRSPHLVEKMVLANTVARTNAWLREIGQAWNLAAGNPEAYYDTTIPVIYSPDFYDRRAEWMARRKELLTTTAFANPDFMARMRRLTTSAESHDVRGGLARIDCPVLLISSEQDHITPPEEQAYLRDHIPGAELVMLPRTGHASFYERPDLFVSIMMGFINHHDPIKLPG
ncbi:MAG: alpha/beta hydrolase [Clostridiales bacterium]|mgnify:CR=1 FL=1|nr:alpha/beta hydrolase [Clostridiales bacterium]